MEVLNDKNFMLYAAKFYDNKNCVDILEFHDDLNRIKYLKRLFKKYKETGDIKTNFTFPAAMGLSGSLLGMLGKGFQKAYKNVNIYSYFF